MLVFSEANSIRFYAVNGLLPSRVNTRSGNEKYGSLTINEYCQRFDVSDTVKVQCVSDLIEVPTVTVQSAAGTATITATLVKSYVADPDPDNWRYYFEFSIVYTSYTGWFQIFAVQNNIEWRSEYQIKDYMLLEVADGESLLIQYTNKTHRSDFPNFQIDYTTDIEMFFYVEAIIRKPESESQEDSYTNQSNKELIGFQYFDGSLLETGAIPKFVERKIKIAAGHFLFVVNNVEYKAKESSVEEYGKTNHVILTMPIIEKSALALSSDDLGKIYEESLMMLTRKIDALTSTATFIVPAGYIIHEFVCGHALASLADYTFKAGYTVGAEDLIEPFIGEVPLLGGNIAIPTHAQKVFDTAQTIYVEMVTGVGAIGKIWVQLLYNG